ncbi:MAG: M1 family metallopeptidase, partial [Planctomycetota bacterium]|nr:M1 family metallopeptidase [Planctomycetota bacterium]
MVLLPRHRITAVLVCIVACSKAEPVIAQPAENLKFGQQDSFRQLEELLPTPNEARNASGAPGQGYWQQRADYEINVTLDDDKRRVIGSESITYHNFSPDTLNYLWLQLEANIFAPDSDANLTATAPASLSRISFKNLESMLARESFDGSMKIKSVQDAAGRGMDFTVVKTMMRIDLKQPLKPKQNIKFSVAWEYEINDSKLVSARTGFEFFEKDKNAIYEMAHWYPRMAAYTDVNGWQHKQFLGRGEFTLEMGDFLVRIQVPDDHIVGATGVLQNPDKVLTPQQRERLAQARVAKKPQFIVTPDEAKQNEKTKPTGNKIWVFKAENVRDFAFASSRKFIWDAQGHDINGNKTLAMSFYPKEAEPLWSKYSTHAIIHTLNVYSRYTFDYPYPVAISVNGPVYGMEYPMICFNGPRPEADGTYSKRTKYGLISVVIHEVGHNYFPMIVNSDERQWTWMDEGLNSFLQYLAEQEWEDKYPSRSGEPQRIVAYMQSSNQVPIMTNSESILQFGPNAYSKPAVGLNILRETILGRKQFDFAFKEYARRWKFKRPQPADLFRTMEDASGIDLDWFWYGWFYTTGHCDLAIDGVRQLNIDTSDPDVEKPLKKKERDDQPVTQSETRNKDLPKRVDQFPDLKDFYNDFDDKKITDGERKAFQNFVKGLSPQERERLKSKQNFYIVDFSNAAQLVMPIILEIEFTDGTKQELRIPAEIWRRNNKKVSKLVITSKEIKSLTLDPHLETADADLSNNHFPPRIVKSRFKLFKETKQKNEMQRASDVKKAAEAKKKAAEAKKKTSKP